MRQPKRKGARSCIIGLLHSRAIKPKIGECHLVKDLIITKKQQLIFKWKQSLLMKIKTFLPYQMRKGWRKTYLPRTVVWRFIHDSLGSQGAFSCVLYAQVNFSAFVTVRAPKPNDLVLFEISVFRKGFYFREIPKSNLPCGKGKISLHWLVHWCF